MNSTPRARSVATFARVAEKTGHVEFVGYEQIVDVASTVKAIVINGEEHDALHPRQEAEVVLNPTQGQCGRAVFLAPSCRFTSRASIVECK